MGVCHVWAYRSSIPTCPQDITRSYNCFDTSLTRFKSFCSRKVSDALFRRGSMPMKAVKGHHLSDRVPRTNFLENWHSTMRYNEYKLHQVTQSIVCHSWYRPAQHVTQNAYHKYRRHKLVNTLGSYIMLKEEGHLLPGSKRKGGSSSFFKIGNMTFWQTMTNPKISRYILNCK